MTENAQLLQVIALSKVFIPVTDEFHTVNDLIPDDQEVFSIHPDVLVVDALDMMRERDYSQLPVLAGETVLGVFSYRSFSEKYKTLNRDKEKPDLNQMIVRDFLEKPHYVQVSDDLDEIIQPITTFDYLLVGQRERLLGIITVTDLSQFAFRYASIWVLFSEIELTLRKLILACVDDQKFLELARLTLTHYSEKKRPQTVQDMNFNDYLTMMFHEGCYQYFEGVFGQNEWHRNKARSNLDEIRLLRNNAFHFKREITTQDLVNLLGYRDWIKTLAAAYEGQKQGVL